MAPLPTTTTTTTTNPDEKSERDLLEEMVKERDEKIRLVESIRTKQEMSLIALKSELHQMRIKQREESYWHRVDMEKLRVLKETAEKRTADLDKKIREGADPSSIIRLPLKIDRNYVSQLQVQLHKSMQTIGILDNQMTLVKRSCDEIIKSLKVDMAEALDDRCVIEMDLLNQLSKLDNEKQIMEDSFRVKLQEREDDVRRLEKETKKARKEQRKAQRASEKLRTTSPPLATSDDGATTITGTSGHAVRSQSMPVLPGGDNSLQRQIEDGLSAVEDLSSLGLIRDNHNLQRELMSKLATVTKEKDAMEDDLRNQLKERRETIDRLVESHVEQQKEMVMLQDQKRELKTILAKEYDEIMHTMIKDRQDGISGLERVEAIRNRGEESVKTLERLFDRVGTMTNETTTTTTTNDSNNNNNNKSTDDDSFRQKMTAILEKTALLHEEIKISLHLVELKLTNQLEKLKNKTLFLSLDELQQQQLQSIPGTDASSSSSSPPEEQFHLATILTTVREIREDAISSLRLVEKNATLQFEKYDVEMKDLQRERDETVDRMGRMERTIFDLERSLSRSAAAAANNGDGDDDWNSNNPQEDNSNNNNEQRRQAGGDDTTTTADPSLMRKLQEEVYTVVERVREKNITIGKLTTVVEEQKVREAALKKELKAMKKKMKLMENDDAIMALEKGFMSEF